MGELGFQAFLICVGVGAAALYFLMPTLSKDPVEVFLLAYEEAFGMLPGQLKRWGQMGEPFAGTSFIHCGGNGDLIYIAYKSFSSTPLCSGFNERFTGGSLFGIATNAIDILMTTPEDLDNPAFFPWRGESALGWMQGHDEIHSSEDRPGAR